MPNLPQSIDRRSRPRGRLGRKLVLSFVALAMLVVGGSGWVLYEQTLESLEDQMSIHLVAEAQLLANGLSVDILTKLRPGFENLNWYRSQQNRLRAAQEHLGARRIYVFDRDGRSLIDTQPRIPIGRDLHLDMRDRSELEEAFSGSAVHTVRFTDRGGIDYMTGYAPIHLRGEVVAAVGLDIGPGYTSAIRAFKRSIYLFAGLGALLTLLVGLGMARHITRPVRRLVTAAREIGRGNLVQAIVTEAADEIGYLGDTMEEMRQKLLARDAQLRQMLAGVAHEIRNPLGGIEIYAGLIADDLPDEDPRKQHIQKVIAEVRNLNAVISEFLDFARPAAPSPESVSVSQLVADVAFLLSPEMEAAGVEYRQDVAPDLKAYVDAEQIKRALLNLMKNAIQSMSEGGRLEVRAAATSDEVAVAVIDTGPGIPEKAQGRLFEPFFTTRERGSGLGLAIVHQAVEKNRGSVEVTTIPGEGTTFTLHLPADSTVAETAPEQAG
ncbi:ATP-binding protein [Candidatus Latescibacterota bacterium]